MNIPFIGSDECSHDEWELKPPNEVAHDARWAGNDAVFTRTKTYYEYCTECGERLSHIGMDSEGKVGWETLESFTIPAEVIEQYRDDSTPDYSENRS